MTSQITVGEYLIKHLYDNNVKHIFGIPGDYILGFYDLLAKSKIQIVTTCDEQGAGFAADAYARIQGLGAVCITYCVGGLKILNTVAEAFAEKSPIIVISGAPGVNERKQSPLLHHIVNDFDTQHRIFKQVTVATAVLNDTNTIISDINRVISSVFRYKIPGYIELPRDMVNKKITAPNFCKVSNVFSNKKALQEALQETAQMIKSSSKPVIVAGVEIQRHGLQELLLKLLEKTRIPVVSTPLSKSVISENHPLYLGVYEGSMGFHNVRQYVESSDCVIMIGSFMTDVDFGNSPTPVDQGKTINITSSRFLIKHHSYEDVELTEFLKALCESKLIKRHLIDSQLFESHKNGKKSSINRISNRKINVNLLFQILNDYINENNMIIADVGDSLFGGLDLFIHKGTEFLSPAFYLSMGFAIPASVGAQLANPDVRPIVLVGDGAFQMTGIELSTVAKQNLNPIVILLNNDGYRTERTMLDGTFNNIPQWNYTKIIDLLGKGKSFKVKTTDEFYKALAKSEQNSEYTLIEVELNRFDGSNALKRMTESFSKKIR